MPVYLAGCSNLVVVAGVTYTKRLWCVMELFVFVRMGGKKEDIVAKLLDPNADRAKLAATFDAGRSRCFLDRDRQRLLAVIEASFGTFQPFNAIVHTILVENVGSGEA